MGNHYWTPQTVGKVQLVDLDGNTVNPVPVINVSEGSMDTTGLAQSSKQDAQTEAIAEVRDAVLANTPVTIANEELPLPTGAATQADQALTIERLNTLISLLGSNLSVVLDNTEALNVSVASLPLPTGASTAAKQDALLAALTNGLSVTVANDLQTAITSLPAVSLAPNQEVAVNGTVNIGNYPVTQNVSGSVEVTNFPATTRVSGVDTPVPVTANAPFPVTQSGSWALNVGNFPATQAVSLASVPAHPVTQSGTWTFGMSAPGATGPAATGYRNAAVLASPQAVKTSGGRILNYRIANPNSTWSYIQVYNTAVAGTTVGTTVPLVTLGIPANSVLDGTWMFSFNFGTAITIAATTTATGSTAPANGLIVNLGYI